MCSPSLAFARRLLSAVALAGLWFVASPSFASCVDDGLHIAHPQIRATAPNAPVSAGYLQLTNQTGQTQTLISASAPFAGRTELHDMKHEDGDGMNGDSNLSHSVCTSKQGRQSRDDDTN